ncbi:MAG: alpha/beta hydrolase [Pseudomonadota bacterium]
MIFTQLNVSRIESQYPPVGQFSEMAEGRLHYTDMGSAADGQTPVFFVHGASGNLLDQQGAFKEAIEGRYRGIFVDRPGYGYSDRMGADDPAKQAALYAQLLDELQIDQVVLVGHSLGSASVAAFAVLYPDRVRGLVFLAPATHPWPGGVTWYYELAAMPVIGRLFTETVAMPAGLQSLASGAKGVFDPQEAPPSYVENAALALILRPASFRYNAQDVAGLNAFSRAFSRRYKEIKAPAVVITGDKDDIVAPEIHSLGLERDIEGAELVVIPGLGHKPDYAETARVMDAIEKVMQAAR